MIVPILISWFLKVQILLASPIYCGLENPKLDINRFFPEATSYKIRDFIPERKLKNDEMEIKALPFPIADKNYEFYLIYKNENFIGLILGTLWAEGELFVGYDIKGIKDFSKNKIKDLYFQKINITDAEYFRSKFYRSQFMQFSMAKAPDYKTTLPPRRSPSRETLEYHQHILNLVKGNSIIARTFLNRVSQDLQINQ